MQTDLSRKRGLRKKNVNLGEWFLSFSMQKINQKNLLEMQIPEIVSGVSATSFPRSCWCRWVTSHS